MKHAFSQDLVKAMSGFGFREVESASYVMPHVELLLKRQTWNTNRAIVVAASQQVPIDFANYLRELRRQVACHCGFFPVFWGIGIQAILIAPGFSQGNIDPTKHIALVDNQWAIIQSIYLVDSSTQTFRLACTWGQILPASL